MMGPHRPKYAALEAYAGGLLSPAGIARLERHVGGCDTCLEALFSIRRYQELRAEAQAESVPEISWERFEQALECELESTGGPTGPGDLGLRAEPRPSTAGAPVLDSGSRVEPRRSAPRSRAATSGKVIALAWPILALAATFVLGFLALSEHGEEAVVAPKAAPVAPREEALAEGWVTLVSREAELEEQGQRALARPGRVVREGMAFRTGADSELHVALSGGTGIIAEGESQIRMTRLRERSIELALERGSVFQQVKKLSTDERFEVFFGPYVARVRGTRFRVQHGQSSAVSVYEGRVVVHAGERLVADLSAGQDWTSAPETPPAGSRGRAAKKGSAEQDRVVHGADPASQGWANLELPSAPGVATWHVDGAPLVALGGLAMRVPAGDVVLHLSDLHGLERSLSLRVSPEGSVLDEILIRDLLAAQNEATGYLAPEQIEPVVRAGLDPLRRCYERGLKRDPKLAGKLLLSIRVAPDGHVARAQLRSAEDRSLALDVESCVQMEARGWRFPRPTGGSVVFELPLNFKAAR